jgi:hypothetical protein
MADLVEQALGGAEDIEQLGDCQPVPHGPTLGTIDDKTALAQARKVPRHVRLAGAQLADQIGHPTLPVGKVPQDREPHRITQPAEQLRRDPQVGRLTLTYRHLVMV